MKALLILAGLCFQLLTCLAACCCSGGRAAAVLQVPVKDRAGHIVMTYHMDVRIEQVETLQVQQGQYGTMRQDERFNLHELMEPAMSNGRVLAGAYGR
jgi:hypothetical protein